MSEALLELKPEKPVNVLIVDDIEENLIALESVLRAPGINVVRANNGNQALGLMLEKTFACVLLDVQMPQMDGFEVARLIRGDETTRHIPIIFVTAYSSDEQAMVRGYESGAVDYLLKPLQPWVVRSKVRVFADLFRQKQTIENQATSLQTLNRELSSSNEDLERFAYLASHDLKEPLRMISYHCQILQNNFGPKLGTEAETLIQNAVNAAKRMYLLIADLLAYSQVRSEKDQKIWVGLDNLLSEVLLDLKPAIMESKAQVTCDPLPRVLVNEIQFRQLLQNLIVNSLKYRSDETPKIHISAEKKWENWMFSVRDNGMGIDPKYKEKIFGLFQRLHTKREYPGTGLGLAICAKIIERHSGKIWVESSPGKGSTFYFSLPGNAVSIS